MCKTIIWDNQRFPSPNRQEEYCIYFMNLKSGRQKIINVKDDIEKRALFTKGIDLKRYVGDELELFLLNKSLFL
jgi:hypothetical protein